MTKSSRLVRKRFSAARNSYRECAVVQRLMAAKLTGELVKCIDASECLRQRPLDVLEIGCGTGLLTEQLVQYVKGVNSYIFNDLYADAKHYAPVIAVPYVDNVRFITADASDIVLPYSVDIVVGNAVIQWVDDLRQLFCTLGNQVNSGGLVAFSSFFSGHYKEIHLITGKGLSYPTKDAIQNCANPFFDVVSHERETKTLYFDSPLEVLRHMKNTGVNAIEGAQWQRRHIKEFSNAYARFKTSSGYPLTYCPHYIVLQKREM